MSNLNSETIKAKEIKANTVLVESAALQRSSNRFVPFLSKLWAFLLSQKKCLNSLCILLTVRFLAAGLGFVVTVGIANAIGKEQFGQLAYALVLGTYGMTVTRFGLERTLTRDLIHFPDRFAELVATSLVLRVLVFAVILLVFTGIKMLYGSAAYLSYAVIGIMAATSLMSIDLRSVYDAWYMMGRHAIYFLIHRCFYFVCVWPILLTCPEKLTISVIAWAMIGGVIVDLALQYHYALKRIPSFTLNTSLLSKSIAMGKQNIWVCLADLGGLSFGSLNQLVLRHTHGTSELGGYAVAWQIASIAMIFFMQVIRVGSPTTAAVTRPGVLKGVRVRFLLKYAALMFFVASVICLPALLFPEVIMNRLFKPEYGSVANILRVMSIYMMMYSLGLVASQYIVSARMEKTYFASIVFGGCLSAILCLVLIPKMGGLGAVTALLIGHGISMCINAVFTVKQVLSVQVHTQNKSVHSDSVEVEAYD